MHFLFQQKNRQPYSESKFYDRRANIRPHKCHRPNHAVVNISIDFNDDVLLVFPVGRAKVLQRRPQFFQSAFEFNQRFFLQCLNRANLPARDLRKWRSD
jgi:hypothetical protein